MTVHIDQAAPHEIEACAAIFAAAFLDDAVLRAFVRGDHHREERLTEMLVAELRSGPAYSGVIDVARTEPGGPPVGAAAWEGPDGHAPWWVRLGQAPRLLHAIGLRHARPSLRALAAFGEARPTDPHWYLADIAVAPTAQGLGVGSALLRHRLGAIDDGPRLPAYLEATTPGSRRLYTRWGFEPTGRIVVDDAEATAMTRPAAA
ncbi:GCN5-related N-acetyltransferase [Xylanimonas cellulosilytica DSM 15894]|uniref:GCN5-related N-acetyltransferase n=1 Tax=Xylanimonas cellulosilytica (strain DSM 15894 / JCM 12276 / CECT 5975 / KCTC 9989 / LMG 20990 / NBRC 107835 / XIL07) TaxID=446471 RepID=D1BVR7_XYLCX|nr:GNAT family N-acetyltransferase [Xylanimonas cellulosilytica]ACZ31386.1 GCN5-related N-acetyltransferase [Xylanimonas cellulosilytica DSM 15894]